MSQAPFVFYRGAAAIATEKMKTRLFLTASFSLFCSAVSAQSSFAGFYGQFSSGYESNQLTKITGSSREVPSTGHDVYTLPMSQTFGGAPLIFGLGYYWQMSPSWLLGVGIDYSALSQTSSSMIATVRDDTQGVDLLPRGSAMTANGKSVQLHGRYNYFISPAYAIDNEKLLYLKAGYTQISSKVKRATSVTTINNGISTTIPTTTAGSYDNSTDGGYMLGIGYRQILTKGLYGFVEANYFSYNTSQTSSYSSIGNSASKSAVGLRNTSATSIIGSHSLNSYQLLVGIGYSF